MSDTTSDNGQTIDRRRVLVSLAAALAVHGVLFLAFALGLGSRGAPVLPPVTIELQSSTGLGSDVSAPAGGSSGGAPAGPAGGAPVATAGPAAAKTASPAAAPASSAGTSGGFVIPTPRAQQAEAAPQGGSAFREAGGRTGVAKGIPSVPGPSTGPVVPPVKQGSGSGTASSSGAGSTQRSGTGVVVPGPSGSSQAPLDLGKLDQSLAGGGTGKGAQGTGGSGGTGSGGKGSTSGTGSGGAGGTGTGAGTGGSGQGFNVVWGSSEAGKGRTMTISVKPKIPTWVSEKGLTLSVKVGFTVLADGVISAAAIEQSSGYADVDARVMEAIRMCLFNAAPGAAPAHGSIPYLINPR